MSYLAWITYHLLAGTKLGSVPPPTRHIPAPQPLLVLRGNAIVNGIGLRGSPMAELIVDHDHAELRCPLADVVRISRAEITALRWSKSLLSTWRLRFDTDSGRLDTVTFFPRHHRAAQHELHRLGWD